MASLPAPVPRPGGVRPPQSAPAGGSGAMFDAIAGRYDRLNRILSLGIDRRWRRQTVEALALPPKARVLDLATGTADLAIAIAMAHPDAAVVGIDPAENMLAVGSAKLRAMDLQDRIELELGDAQELPFEDDTFDGTTIAFGIRNVPDRSRALSEMARVTTAGAKIAILELSEPRGGLLAPAARFHIRTVVPRVGALLSGSKEYRYLQQSIAAFPAAGEFVEMMRAQGLRHVRAIPLTFGVCHLYVAEAPEGAP